jgi:hypothetical protein
MNAHRRRAWIKVLPITASLWMAACATSSEAPDTGPTALLDGKEKTFLVVGYSTSYAWPAMLQEMLDEHTDGERVYHLMNAVAGGAAVEIWNAAPGTRDHDRTIAAAKCDFFGGMRLLGSAPRPTVALCQQSLQFTRTQRGPIARADDDEGIEIGADALEKLAHSLRALGIDTVVYAMHIYKHPIEPEVGNERLALARLLGRGHDFILAGPDVWERTRDEYPDCFAEDGLHPNERGMKLMAEAWYRSLTGDAAREDIVERMYAKDYDVERMMDGYLAWRRRA